MRTSGTSVKGSMFLLNKYLLHVYYVPGTGLLALRTLFYSILPVYY